MLKHLLISFLSFLLLNNVAVAQVAKKDTAMYYLKNYGKIVSTKDSADDILMVLAPKKSADSDLFIVKEYDLDGKLVMDGYSLNNDKQLKYEGNKTFYSPDGNKRRVENYINNKIDFVTEYYANGKIYATKRFPLKTPQQALNDLLLVSCYDSLGNVSAKNGNGLWIEYNIYSHKNLGQGPIKDSLKIGEWHFKVSDKSIATTFYEAGKAVRCSFTMQDGVEVNYPTNQVPEFPGGIPGLYHYLGTSVKYPEIAYKSNIQGRVIISFVIDFDGSVTDVKLVKGIGGGCDEEALRVIKASPNWKPGIQNGQPVKVAYSVPISFSLKK